MKKQVNKTDVVSEKKDTNVASMMTANVGLQTLSATFTKPYSAHASIGPSCAVAQWTQGKLQVWCHSQGVFPLRGDLAKALRVNATDITVAHVEGSGCYGHNGADDVALDAALLARALPGVPVKLQWMHEDEFQWEPLGSPMTIALQATLGKDSSGSLKIIDWHHELWSYAHSTRPYDPDGVNLQAAWDMANPLPAGPSRNIAQPSGGSDRNAVPLYVFPQQKVTNHLLQSQPIRTSALRTLGAYANVFATESFMDELANMAGVDALAFRMNHLADPRAKAVLERVAAMAKYQTSWGQAPRAAVGGVQKGRGMAFAKYKNLAVYCAVIVDVSVNLKSGALQVDSVFAAVDAGLVINPDGLKNQIEGGVIQSTSWTLFEQMNNDASSKTTRSWSDYPVLRFPQMPKVEVALINRPEERPLGVGEGAQGPTVAAIANAFANATGRRVRDLPMTTERVMQLLSA
jgi:CO/xanthine dehydrogenase Mo-binding subunit